MTTRYRVSVTCLVAVSLCLVGCSKGEPTAESLVDASPSYGGIFLMLFVGFVGLWAFAHIAAEPGEFVARQVLISRLGLSPITHAIVFGFFCVGLMGAIMVAFRQSEINEQQVLGSMCDRGDADACLKCANECELGWSAVASRAVLTKKACRLEPNRLLCDPRMRILEGNHSARIAQNR